MTSRRRSVVRAAVVLAAIASGCYQADDDDLDVAIFRYTAAQAARHRRAAASDPGPPIVAAIERAVSRAAVDGAWVMPMSPGGDSLALEIHGERATVVDGGGEYSARVTWTLPCEIEVRFTDHDGLDTRQPFEIQPVGHDVRLVSGVVAVPVGDSTIACINGSLYVRDATGACARWQRDATAGWRHVFDDCGYLTSRTAQARALMSVREPDLAVARAARDAVAARP